MIRATSSRGLEPWRTPSTVRSALSGAAVIGLAGALAAGAACHEPKHDRLRWAIGVAKFGAPALGLFAPQDLYLATSPDLVTWTLRPQPLLDHGDPVLGSALGVESLYRSTGVVEHGALVVWYAMQTRP